MDFEEIVEEIEGAGTAVGDQLLAELLFGGNVKSATALPNVERFRSKPGIRDLPPEERKAYQREAVRAHREKLKAQKAQGNPEPTKDAVREALADAAIMLLAVDGPGAEQVRAYLERAFPGRSGVPITVTSRARSGKLRPRSLKSPTI